MRGGGEPAEGLELRGDAHCRFVINKNAEPAMDHIRRRILVVLWAPKIISPDARTRTPAWDKHRQSGEAGPGHWGGAL